MYNRFWWFGGFVILMVVAVVSLYHVWWLSTTPVDSLTQYDPAVTVEIPELHVTDCKVVLVDQSMTIVNNEPVETVYYQTVTVNEEVYLKKRVALQPGEVFVVTPTALMELGVYRMANSCHPDDALQLLWGNVQPLLVQSN